MPGVVKIVRDGSFLAVVAEREYQAIAAMTALATAAKWEGAMSLPEPRDVFTHLLQQPAQTSTILDRGTVAADRSARSRRLSIAAIRCTAPSAHPAQSRDRRTGLMTVWTHTQGVFPLRDAIAKMLGVAEEHVRCIHTEGSGCYGHNGADDVAADAALIAASLPGRPVRVQWMREEEHAWEPYGSAMVRKCARPCRTGASPHGNTTCGAARIRRGRAATPAICPPPDISRSRISRRRLARFRCRTAAATATPFRSTLRQRQGRASLHPCDAAARIIAAFARRLHECVHDREPAGRAAARQMAIRSNSACAISTIRAPRTSWKPLPSSFGWTRRPRKDAGADSLMPATEPVQLCGDCGRSRDRPRERTHSIRAGGRGCGLWPPQPRRHPQPD